MASRIEEFDEKILACAKEEFLEKGYTDASIRTIAQNAGVSTSTIYTRYSDKEGLFRFLVEPAANGLKELLRQSLTSFSSLTKREQNERFMEYSDRGFEVVIAYIYEYFFEFKLLITGAPGNYYQEFLEGLVKLDTDCTKKFLIQVGSKALSEGRITDGFLHVVSSAFYSGIFEVVIHDMPMEEAKKYINELRAFMGMAGKNIIKNKKEGAKEMQKTEGFCVDESGWIHCPSCKCRTRTKIRADTSLRNFPIFCPKCKQECLIDVDNMKIQLSVVPDAKTQSR